jgi:predicted GNAT family acetyltransferase
MEREGRQVGELHYRRAGARILITHTEVAAEMREQASGNFSSTPPRSGRARRT